MEDEVPERSLPLRAAPPELSDSTDDLLMFDRPSWAWEFLRRNQTFRAALKGQKRFKRHTCSNVTTIEATVCAPEVRNFGICFRGRSDRAVSRQRRILGGWCRPKHCARAR